jgi:cyclophilin family peptidyl-prolyl cis-trans isomerase
MIIVKTWGILIVLMVALVAVYAWLSGTPTGQEREEVYRNPPPPKPPSRRATLTPGRVLDLHTVRGIIEVVLFEKDCPLTTARIAELVEHKCYDNAPFQRAEPEKLIQIGGHRGPLTPVKRELVQGLLNEKGAVGIARGKNPDSATSAFYILMEPQHDLDYSYAVFGRVIRGMDVVTKIRVGDKITKAVVRPSTAEDRSLLMRALQIEVERKTN